MKSQAVCLLVLVGLSGATAGKVDVTPVQKVIQLLSGMLEKGKDAKHQEQVMFAESRQFCDDTQAQTSSAITEEEHTMEGLEALIGKDTADAAHLLKLISFLDSEQDRWSGDIKAAKKVRDIEAADYQELHKDYSESVTAIAHAIEVLKKESYDRKQKTALTQVANLKKFSLIPDSAKKALDLFLQAGEDSEADAKLDEEGAPAANAYEFQAGGMIDMLEKLQDKFIDERTTIEKQETNSKHAYEMLCQELKAQILEALNQQGDKKGRRASRLSSKASEEGDLKDETDIHTDDEAYLKELKATCQMKAEDFEARQKLRAEEISTIEGAVELLSSSAVSGNAEKHLPTLVQKTSSFVQQLRSNSNSQRQQSVAKYLSSQASKLHSRVLAKIAERVSEDPFSKVKKMLKDLIVRLMEEANEEAEHKGWCDTELSTNEQTRKEKTEAVESLHAEADQLEASITKLTDDITDLSNAVANLDKAMAEATKLRGEEKTKADETVDDAQQAQTALAQAVTVLKEFYAKAAEATSFAQIEPYKGMQEENGGVIGMLEVIESDFARLESETKAAEATAQKEYDEFMTDSKVDKAAKAKDVEHRTSKKQDQSGHLINVKNDLDGTQHELDSALTYFEKLKPSCVDAGVSYEDRVARRKEEIESLQEGLRVLNGEDLA